MSKRQRLLLNEEWTFVKEAENCQEAAKKAGEAVALPHTWNAKDGQDGGNDYYRGTCWYRRTLPEAAYNAVKNGGEAWLEIGGAAMTAEVYLNEKKLGQHAGGYAAFRVNLTDNLRGKDTLVISVDNSANRTVYPQRADFTFYGGLYRDVYLILVPKLHFALDHHGDKGIAVQADLTEDHQEAKVQVAAFAPSGETVTFRLEDEYRQAVSREGVAKTKFSLHHPRLWDGLDAPNLYFITASLESGDTVEAHFGCRSIRVDAQQGFLLNGRPYRLCGVARHQDRLGKGNALSLADHAEDMDLILESGANCVRLAHYQHDQAFYDLCDAKGLLAWAEIPCITEWMESTLPNAEQQLTELVAQCRNHPSVFCWCLSNEITTTGGDTSETRAGLKKLNALCHDMDLSRPTVIANVFMLDPDSETVTIPDIAAYNLYYGWYVGGMEENERWLDAFHEKHPDIPIALSEYGADANPAYQSGKPEQGDWTESYQVKYHAHMLNLWQERPWLWGMFCWNMFDFGADGRNEGGKPGQNQKGLVTFDRALKKDAFYVYKAFLSKEPFVHVCGGRYVDRAEDETEILVCSNLPEISLYRDGQLIATKRNKQITSFRVPLSGKHTIEARSGEYSSIILIQKAAQPNESYILPGKRGQVENWFDRADEIERTGYYSLHSTMGELAQNPEADAVLQPLRERVLAAYGDVAQHTEVPEAMKKMLERMTVEQYLRQMGALVSGDMAREINRNLNAIPVI